MARGGQNAKVSEAEFVNIWHQEGGSPAKVAERIGVSDVRAVYARRDRLAEKGVVLPSIATGNAPATWGTSYKPAYPQRKDAALLNGTIIVGSDAHVWPGEFTPAMQGFLNVIDEVQPDIVVANGDWFDGARVSRHGRTGWQQTPTLRQEREALQEYCARVAAVARAANPSVMLEWNMGNHCLRYDNYLSSRAAELEDEENSRLSDHFPAWSFQWGLYVNFDHGHPLVIKHRGPSGSIHAGYNNTLKGGVSIATGHTHLLESKPLGDYRIERRYGIQTGTLARPNGPQFEYTEGNASAALSGFVVLTFIDGLLMPPEFAEVLDGRCWFRNRAVA